MKTTDRPLGGVDHCKHRTQHLHGTETAYAVCKCRCEHCRAASARATRNYREELLRKQALYDRPTTPIETCTHTPKHLHGTSVGYQTCKCLCGQCRAASNRRINLSKSGHLSKQTKPRTPAKAPHPEDEAPGHYLQTEPRVDYLTARKAALVVVSHIADIEDARDVLEVLGIKELAR